MIIDSSELSNAERMECAIVGLELGRLVEVKLHNSPGDSMCREWLGNMLRARGHSEEGAEILLGGVTFYKDKPAKKEELAEGSSL